MEGIFDIILSLAGSFVAIFALIPLALKFPLTILFSIILSTYIYFNKRIGKIIVKFYLILLFLFIIIMIYVESNQERAQFYSENRFIYLLQNYWFHYLLFGVVLFLVITNMEAIIKKIQSWKRK